jgi:hypothetical protein
MGIFMITISQISSHTTVGVYPRSQGSTSHGGLQFPMEEPLPRGVVLRYVERRAGGVGVDPLRGRDAHR